MTSLPVRARLDGGLRLLQTDAPIEALQLAAGAALDGPLAPPQLAGIARLAQRLGEPVTRLVHVATEGGDAELWARIEPDGDTLVLTIEEWRPLTPAGPRLEGLAPEPPAPPAPTFHGIMLDGGLRLAAIEGEAARWFDTAQEGEPLSRIVRFEEEAGAFPLLDALATRDAFAGQRAQLRDRDEAIVLAGIPVLEDGQFRGYRVTVTPGAAPRAGQGETRAPGDGGLDATLRSPLDRIIRAADQIVDRSDGPIRSDYADYAGDIATAGRHLLSVIRSMSEQVVSEREEVKLSLVAREAAGLVAARATAKEIDIEIDDDLSVVAIGERRAVVQILVNILGNAIRHSPRGGTVAMVFDEEKGRARVTVADQGPGIARDDQARIFEKFERLDAEEGTGTGLGLAISRRLARSMNGEIELVSAAGEGARFTLSLPSA